jgi:hypothetical protein
MRVGLAHELAFTSVVKQSKRSVATRSCCSTALIVSTLLCPFFLHQSATLSTMQLALH